MDTIDRFTALAPKILGVTRILAGIMFACHGAQKLLGVFGGIPPGAAPAWIIWTAGPIELVGGVLLALGLFSRSAAFVSSGLMAAAYFMGHAPNGFWPILNGRRGGDPLLLVIPLPRGAGTGSLDPRQPAPPQPLSGRYSRGSKF